MSATPAVANGAVYFPSWDGNLYAVDAFTGKLKWKRSIGQLITGLIPPVALNAIFNVTVSISTPTIAGELLIVGIYGPAVVIAVKRSTGRLVWSTRIDPLPLSVITMSGTFHSRLMDFISFLFVFVNGTIQNKMNNNFFFFFFP